MLSVRAALVFSWGQPPHNPRQCGIGDSELLRADAIPTILIILSVDPFMQMQPAVP